jgi:hypothetical protein
MSRDSAVDTREVEVRVPVGSSTFTLLYCPYRFWAHPASYQIGTEASVPKGKVSGA